MENDLTPKTMEQLCKSEGVPYTRQHIRRLCASGEISGAYRLPPVVGQWIIPQESAERFIREKKNEL